MKIKILLFFIFFFINPHGIADDKIKPIIEGNINARVKLIVYESLTCSHCANFHKDVYPKLKDEFFDKGLASIEFRNFPLDIAALNASKLAHCKNDGKANILHFLYFKQEEWLKGNTIEELNSNLKDVIKNENFGLNFEKCLADKNIEDHILEDRIEGANKFKINATPTIIINDEKFEKALNFKNLKKAIEKLI
ncbi:MAG: thioredoxin domain-containing protein [Candidatus Pelagibacter sp.]